MAIIPNRMIHRRRSHCDSVKCYFVLLLVSIATISFQEKRIAVFALEDGQANKGERRQFVVANAAEQLQRKEQETGDEVITIIKKNKRTGEKREIELCKWVGKRKRRRCNMIVRKRTTNEEDGTKEIVKYNPRIQCEDVCDGVPTKAPKILTTPPPTEAEKSITTSPPTLSCPREEADMAGQLSGTPCTDDGYNFGRTCHYEFTGVGCTADTFRCMPLVTCKCGVNSSDPNFASSWMCYSYLPPDEYDCTEPRPKPDGWEEPPEGLQKPCTLGSDEQVLILL